MDPLAPGWRTTEFWKSLIPQAISLLLVLHVVTRAEDAATLTQALLRGAEAAFSLAASVATVVQYVRSRTELKQAAVIASGAGQKDEAR